MASYENIYSGASSSFEPESGNPSQYRVNTANIAFPSDPLTANQLQAVSKKISTGARTIEVSGLGLAARSAMAHLAAIPKQHWQEIDRLRKLTGVDLTFHGPLIEPTGVVRNNWTEDQRKEVERQGFEAVKLAQQMNPEGNVVVTFHSSNGLDPVQQRIKVGKNPDGSPIEKVVNLAVVNERSGQVGTLPPLEKEYLESNGEINIKKWLDQRNEDSWVREIDNIAFENNRARREIHEAMNLPIEKEESEKVDQQVGSFENLLKLSRKNPREFEEKMKVLEGIDPKIRHIVQQRSIPYLNDATIFLNQAYLRFKDAYSTAYQDTISNKDDPNNAKNLAKLEEIKKRIVPVAAEYKDTKSANFLELSKELDHALSSLQDIAPPRALKPVLDWAVEKAGTTFGNIAWESYKKFKEHTPIISIENPPVGLTGMTRADEIEKLIIQSRKVFVNNAVEKGMSAKEAKEKAEKIIGATWDTGHINSMRKWGYDEADVLGEARKISKYVKHMHIADNLGFEDAELPAGMGNAPIADVINLFPKNIKRVIETGDWFSRQGGMAMAHTPTREAFEGLGAPIYSMGESPWGSINQAYGGYFGGLGPINPPVHHSTYGSGFSGLPVELGGEIPGQGGQSRFSGTPME